MLVRYYLSKLLPPDGGNKSNRAETDDIVIDNALEFVSMHTHTQTGKSVCITEIDASQATHDFLNSQSEIHSLTDTLLSDTPKNTSAIASYLATNGINPSTIVATTKADLAEELILKIKPLWTGKIKQ